MQKYSRALYTHVVLKENRFAWAKLSETKLCTPSLHAQVTSSSVMKYIALQQWSLFKAVLFSLWIISICHRVRRKRRLRRPCFSSLSLTLYLQENVSPCPVLKLTISRSSLMHRSKKASIMEFRYLGSLHMAWSKYNIALNRTAYRGRLGTCKCIDISTFIMAV